MTRAVMLLLLVGVLLAGGGAVAGESWTERR
jgi:hypothetical protein